MVTAILRATITICTDRSLLLAIELQPVPHTRPVFSTHLLSPPEDLNKAESSGITSFIALV